MYHTFFTLSLHKDHSQENDRGDHRRVVLRQIQPEEYEKSLQLQTKILQTLKQQHAETFIVPKTLFQFQQINHDQIGTILGVFLDNSQLIAQGILYFNHHEQHHTDPNGICSFTGFNVKNRGLLAGAMVDPDYRGHHLAEKITRTLEQIAQHRTLKFLSVEVNTRNYFSYRIYLKNQFFIYDVVKDPHDGTDSFLLIKPLQGEITYDSYLSSRSVNLHNQSFVADVRDMLKQGYAGVKLEQNDLIFRKICFSEKSMPRFHF